MRSFERVYVYDKRRETLGIVHYWLEKAEQRLASAHREFEAESFSFAMNRLYYTVFYAVSALLLEHNLTFKKHSGVRAAFHQQFIKTGVLDQEWGRLYDQLFEDRQEGDYVIFISFEADYVESQLKQCTQFLKKLRLMIPSVSK